MGMSPPISPMITSETPREIRKVFLIIASISWFEWINGIDWKFQRFEKKEANSV